MFEEEDLYRGQERRDVILMNPADIVRLGLSRDQRVTVRSRTGELRDQRVRPFDVRAGNAMMSYPEANIWCLVTSTRGRIRRGSKRW